MKDSLKAMSVKKAAMSLGLALAAAFAPAGWAQQFPTKPVTLINPYPAGGGVDVMARLLAQELQAEWGQPVLLDSKPGGGTTISAGYVARAPADGYTLLVSTSQHAVAPWVIRNLTYNYTTSLTGVSVFAESPLILTVRPGLKIETAAQLVSLIKEKGTTMNYGSSGPGGLPHLAGVMLNQATGVNVPHIPYLGTAPAFTALQGEQIDYLFGDISVVPTVKSGRIKALGVTVDKRVPDFPAVPAMVESIPGFVLNVWVGLDAPAGTPRSVIDRINASVQKALKSPALIKRYAELSTQPKWSTPEQFNEFRAAEVKKYGELVKAAGLKAE